MNSLVSRPPLPYSAVSRFRAAAARSDWPPFTIPARASSTAPMFSFASLTGVESQPVQPTRNCCTLSVVVGSVRDRTLPYRPSRSVPKCFAASPVTLPVEPSSRSDDVNLSTSGGAWRPRCDSSDNAISSSPMPVPAIATFAVRDSAMMLARTAARVPGVAAAAVRMATSCAPNIAIAVRPAASPRAAAFVTFIARAS